MAYHSRSPRVVGAHFFAKYGYEDGLMRASAEASENPQDHFWHEVIKVVEGLQDNEQKGIHPCAAMPKQAAGH